MPKIQNVMVVLSRSTYQDTAAELASYMCKIYVRELQKRDAQVDLIDLDLESEFNPFNGEADMSTKIMEYQLRVKRADRCVFFHPTCFYTLPGTLKAWIDEVFVLGFAYGRRRGFVSPLLSKLSSHIFIFSNESEWQVRFIEDSGLLRFWQRTFARMTGIKLKTRLFGDTRSRFEILKKKAKKTAIQFAHECTPDFTPLNSEEE